MDQVFAVKKMCEIFFGKRKISVLGFQGGDGNCKNATIAFPADRKRQQKRDRVGCLGSSSVFSTKKRQCRRRDSKVSLNPKYPVLMGI